MKTPAVVLGEIWVIVGVFFGPLRNAVLPAPPHLRPLTRGEWAGPTNSDTFGVQVVGTNAYVALGYAGLAVLDISDPHRPQRVGGCDTPGFAGGVAVAGAYAYVSDWDQGLQVIDVSNPSQCMPVSGFTTDGYAGEVVVRGRYAFVADWDEGLVVFNVSNPTNCVRVGGYRVSRGTMAVAVAGNYAYLADWRYGLDVVDVSNPTNCSRVANSYFGAYVQDVEVVGNHAYVGDDGGLRVYDITNPRNPVRVGGAGSVISDLAVAGNYVYANNVGRLQLIDVKNPTNCVILGTYKVTEIFNFRNLSCSGNRVYIANGARGLLVLGSIPGLQFTCEIDGGISDMPFVIEATSSLNEPIQWTALLVTNPPVRPFGYTDFDVNVSAKPRKFYRVRQ